MCREVPIQLVFLLTASSLQFAPLSLIPLGIIAMPSAHFSYNMSPDARTGILASAAALVSHQRSSSHLGYLLSQS